MRLSILVLSLLVGCGGPPAGPAPSTPEPPDARPLSDFADEARVRVWPRVPLVPANALAFRVTVDDAQSPGGPVFTIFQVRGDQAVPVPDALPRWKWSEDLTQAILEPEGLERGAPYLLVGESLVGGGAPYATFAHPFRVIAPDITPPDGDRLELRGDPSPGQRGALTLTFPEPMREDVVHSVATLIDGTPQPAPWRLDDDQRTLTWTPPESWSEGLVHVSVGGSAKDVAGNTLVNVPSQPLVPRVPTETPGGTPHRAGGGE